MTRNMLIVYCELSHTECTVHCTVSQSTTDQHLLLYVYSSLVVLHFCGVLGIFLCFKKFFAKLNNIFSQGKQVDIFVSFEEKFS